MHTPDISSLLLQIEGMRTKLVEFKRYRAVYSAMRQLWKKEQQLREVEKAWYLKLTNGLQEIAEDIENDSFGIRLYAAKLLESRPKSCYIATAG